MNVRKTAETALLIALTVVVGILVRIPIGNGIFTLVDLMIYVLAFAFGKKRGLVIGGLSGLLIDLLTGYFQYALFSLVIHSLQGYVAGALNEKRKVLGRVFGVFIGTLIMIGGYFLADMVLFTTKAALADMLTTNIWQGILGSVGGLILYPMLKPVFQQRFTNDGG